MPFGLNSSGRCVKDFSGGRRSILPTIERVPDWESLEPVWNSLVLRSRSRSPFLAWEWLSRWWDAFGAEGELLLLTSRNSPGADIEAIAPLMIIREHGIRTIRFVGAGLSDSLDFIVPPGDAYSVPAFFEFLLKEVRLWDLMWLGDFIDDEGVVRSVEDAARRSGLKSRRICTTRAPYLLLEGTWDGYLAAKSRHFRRVLRQKEDRASHSPHAFSAERIRANFDEVSASAMAAVDCGSWKSREIARSPERRKERDFLDDAMRAFSARGWLDVWLGLEDGRPAAYQIDFDFGGKIWVYNNAFHRDFAPLSLGTLLVKRAVETAFQEGKSECDFLRGEEEFKSAWAGAARDVVQLVLVRPTLRSRLAGSYAVGWGRNIARLKNRLRNRRIRTGDGR
jgi:CelD/BcsL family acetyltransferase involved in cellulose biosynthesis